MSCNFCRCTKPWWYFCNPVLLPSFLFTLWLPLGLFCFDHVKFAMTNFNDLKENRQQTLKWLSTVDRGINTHYCAQNLSLQWKAISVFVGSSPSSHSIFSLKIQHVLEKTISGGRLGRLDSKRGCIGRLMGWNYGKKDARPIGSDTWLVSCKEGGSVYGGKVLQYTVIKLLQYTVQCTYMCQKSRSKWVVMLLQYTVQCTCICRKSRSK